MSMLFMSGWELGLSLDAWTSSTLGTGSGVSTTRCRSGKFSLLFTNSTDVISKTLPSSYSELYFQFAIMWLDFPVAGTYATLRNGSTDLLRIKVTGSSSIFKLLATDGSDTTLATGTTILSPYTFYVVEVYFKVDTSTGVCTTRLNGVQELTYSGNTGSTLVDGIQLKTPTNNDVHFDDVIVNDTSGDYNNTWPDRMFIAGIPAVANSDTVQMQSPVSIDNYYIASSFVRPYNLNFFTAANSTSLTELYDAEPSPIFVTNICAVSLVSYAHTFLYSPNVTAFKFILRSGTTVYESSELSVTSNLSVFTNIWETSPTSGVTWTSSEFNSLDVGVRT